MSFWESATGGGGGIKIPSPWESSIRGNISRASGQAAPSEKERAARAAEERAARESEIKSNQAMSDENLDRYMRAGRERGRAIFGQQALGRLQDTYAPQVAEMLAMRKNQLGGLQAPEYQALRERGMANLNQDLATQMRQARAGAASNGLTGPARAAQQMALQKAGLGQRQGLTRDLAIEDMNRRQQAMNAYEQSLGSNRAADIGRQQYNIGQSNKELYGKLGTEMGYGGLGSQQLGNAASQYWTDMYRNAANAQAQQAQAMPYPQSKPGFFGNVFGDIFGR